MLGKFFDRLTFTEGWMIINSELLIKLMKLTDSEEEERNKIIKLYSQKEEPKNKPIGKYKCTVFNENGSSMDTVINFYDHTVKVEVYILGRRQITGTAEYHWKGSVLLFCNIMCDADPALLFSNDGIAIDVINEETLATYCVKSKATRFWQRD